MHARETEIGLQRSGMKRGRGTYGAKLEGQAHIERLDGDLALRAPLIPRTCRNSDGTR
jgi:hypothetical protein